MKKKHLKFLKQLVETPSPTGFEEPAASLVRERLADVADEVATDTMGSVRAVLEGRDAGAPSLMLAAHMDEIGLMVTYISDEGFLSVASLGGVDAAILPGMRVDVHTASGTLRGIVGRKPIHLIEPDERKTVTPLSSLVIDLGMKPKRVKKLVRVGDPITFGVGFERFGDDMAVSKCFDDKCGVWIACRVMEKLARAGRAPGDFIAVATTQEEIGTRGAMTSAHAVNPDVALAFDVTHATDYPGIDKTKYGKIVCGAGLGHRAGAEHQPCGVRAPCGRCRGGGRSVPAGGRAVGHRHRRPGHPGDARRHPHGAYLRAAALHAHSHRGCLPARSGGHSAPHYPLRAGSRSRDELRAGAGRRCDRECGREGRRRRCRRVRRFRRTRGGVRAVPKREEKTIAKNRRAFHDYEILETYEAGIELTGTEVRSLRENNCQLTDCFALIRSGEVWLNNVHISPYSNGSIFNPDPDRRRKLLLHKKQIRYLDAKVAEKGLAIVPLKMYFNEDGRVKVELALARGKKLYDKRASMKERDTKREIDRALKERVR